MGSVVFYGSLRSLDLLDIVLGDTAHLDVFPFDIADHSICTGGGLGRARLVAAPGATARATRASGLTVADMARLDFYESCFEYQRHILQLATSGLPESLFVYRAVKSVAPSATTWTLPDWRANWCALIRQAAREIIAGFGHTNAEVTAQRLPQISQRAGSTVRAAAKTGGHAIRTDFGRGDVELITHHRPYTNYFAVEEHDLRFRQFDGQFSEPVNRAAFVGGDAVVVLPYDPGRDRVLVIEQFRYGKYQRGDPHPWSLEPIAGRIDAGETPEETAHREAREEAGLTIERLIPISQYYPSSGAYTEFLYSYLGIVDLADDVTGVAGLASEAEDIKSHLLGFDDLMDMVTSGAVEDGQLILATLWLAERRDLIRRKS